MRTFIAVDIPATIKSELSALQTALKHVRASIKWMRPESLHLTLKFLGEVEEARVSAIVNVIEMVSGRHRGLTLNLKGVGVFPHIRNPRIFWIGLDGETECFARLAEDIDIELSKLGFPREERSYNPHLTIGRFKSPLGASDLISQARQYPLPEQTLNVSEITVMRSVLTPEAAVYTPVFNIPLRGISS